MLQIHYAYYVSVHPLPDKRAPLSLAIPWGSRSHAPLGLVSVARRAVSAFRCWWRRTRNRAALTALDDRTLEDIGLTRMVAVYEVDKETLTERSAPIGSGQLIRLRRVANPDNEA
jgi:uncharacterized protein YjiS (DUF1127 family)